MNLQAPPRPDIEPPKKSHRLRNGILIGLAVFFAVPMIRAAVRETPPPVPDVEIPWNAEDTSVTAEMVADLTPAATIDELCDAYFTIGNYDLALVAFKDGYESEMGPNPDPSAAAVFDEILTRC